MKNTKMKYVNLLVGICLGGILMCATSMPSNEAPKKSAKKKSSNSGASAVWILQAQAVHKELGLSPEIRDKFVDTYVACRKSYKTEQHALPDEVDKAKSREITLQLRETKRNELNADLKTFLTDEQTTAAVRYLGIFHPKWDRQVRTLINFNLEKEKLIAAMKLVNDFNVNYEKARSIGINTRNMKDTLNFELSKLLTENQLAKWKEVTDKSKK